MYYSLLHSALCCWLHDQLDHEHPEASASSARGTGDHHHHHDHVGLRATTQSRLRPGDLVAGLMEHLEIVLQNNPVRRRACTDNLGGCTHARARRLPGIVHCIGPSCSGCQRTGAAASGKGMSRARHLGAMHALFAADGGTARPMHWATAWLHARMPTYMRRCVQMEQGTRRVSLALGASLPPINTLEAEDGERLLNLLVRGIGLNFITLHYITCIGSCRNVLVGARGRCKTSNQMH